jgi:hypothetical protein
MWHAVKNDKTAKIHTTFLEPPLLIPNVGATAISADTLRAIGVVESVLDQNPYREMDDPSAKLIFNLTNIRRAHEDGENALALALLPGYLLLSSVLLSKLTRGERIWRLTRLIAIILKYELIWESTRTGNRKKFPSNAAFSRELCAKDITLALALIGEMKKNTDLNLAALGSHLLEHFFALIKRLMGANQTAVDFERAVLKSVTAKAAMTDLSCSFQTKGKSSDSGAVLSASDTTGDPTSFEEHFQEAEKLFALLDCECVTVEEWNDN